MKKIIRYSIFFIAFLICFFLIFSFNLGKDPEELKKKYAYPDSEFIDINGLKVHARVTGSGTPVILLHGVSSSLHTWDIWQRELSKKYKVISIDVPSFGLTGPFPDREYNEKAYVDLLDGVLDHYKIDSCYMAGNSFGGYLTWNYAYNRPKRIMKMALLDAAGLQSKEDQGGNMLTFKLVTLPVIKYFSYYVTPRFLVDESVRKVYGDPSKITEQTYQRYYDLLLRKGNREGFSQIMSMGSRYGREENIAKLKQIKIPTLIMWGDLDDTIAPSYADEFDEYIVNSDKIIYKGVSHVPMEEIPLETVRDFEKFLEEKE